MECILRNITKYPFNPETEKNIMALMYTCFADTLTADQLQIQTHAYRFIRNDQNEEIMLLIIRDDQLVSSEVDPVLHVPFHILRQFQQVHPTVLVIRKIIEMQTFLTPKLKVAQQINLYFNDSLKVDQTLIKTLTQAPFIFKTGDHYLDLTWLSPAIKRIKNLKKKIQFNEHLSQHKQGRYHTYFRVFIEPTNESDPNEYYLFKNGATKVNLKQISLHPYNLYRTITPDKPQKAIFQLEPYQQIRQSLSKFHYSNRIVLLQSESQCGLPEFIHRFSQENMAMNYYQIDCHQVFSTQQFFRRFNWIINLEDSVILIHNLEWLQELYQAEQILSMEMKHIMNKLEHDFQSIIKKSLRHYLVILMYQGKTVTEDMFKQPSSLSLKLDKPLKIFIFKTLFNHYQQHYQQKDQIVQHCHDKFGWQLFKQFLEKQWQNNKEKKPVDVIKEMSKLIKQEQTQNLIEVSWDDVGGLETAKEEIIQTILLPIRHPEIFDQWIKPRTGLLFYGPPGTGKTLLGKCIAKECKMSFISVKGPQLLNMYVGESEKNVRQVFERAIACKPCIVFMDELDALIPKRGNNSDSHQVMDRIVAELLMQMDIASSNQVFVIGATNRPDLLDPSIMRPGRFDKQIYLGITTNREDRIKILKAQTRHLTLQQNLDWEELLDKLPINFTGADFYGLTSKAVMAAAERAILEYEQGIQHEKITITKKDFLVASEHVKPSVTEKDLQRYDQLKKVYS